MQILERNKAFLVLIALLVVLVLWGGWLFAIAGGSGLVDKNGNALGPDFLHQFAAANTLLVEQQEELYDLPHQRTKQQQILGNDAVEVAYFYLPPFYAGALIPLATLPYSLAFLLFSSASLIALGASLKLLGIQRLAAVVAVLSFLPVFENISSGQNALLTLLLFSLCYYAWQSGLSLTAGLILSISLYKAPLALGILLLWLLKKDLRALLGFLLGTAIILGLTVTFLPEALTNYGALVTTHLPQLNTHSGFPLHKQFSLDGFSALLFPGAVVLQKIVASLVKLVFGLLLLRAMNASKVDHALQFSLAILLSLVVTPHCMIYDFSLLLIPCFLLREQFSESRRLQLVVLVWLGVYLAPGLVSLQLDLFERALQLGTLSLLFLALQLARRPVQALE